MLQGAKGLVAKLGPPYIKSAWGSKGERVRVARLAVCCNYFSKKKKVMLQGEYFISISFC